jgi:predicted RecB family nuclease
MSDKAALRRLQVIPGVGPSMARDLLGLGYTSVEELAGQDPEAMYQRFMDQAGQHIDRCVLYVFRCAVYFASVDRHDPEKLKWWTWKG